MADAMEEMSEWPNEKYSLTFVCCIRLRRLQRLRRQNGHHLQRCPRRGRAGSHRRRCSRRQVHWKCRRCCRHRGRRLPVTRVQAPALGVSEGPAASGSKRDRENESGWRGNTPSFLPSFLRKANRGIEAVDPLMDVVVNYPLPLATCRTKTHFWSGEVGG